MGCGSSSAAPPMIDSVLGTSAGSPTELKTMNAPRRSTFASEIRCIGGSDGRTPSPCHWPRSGSNTLIGGMSRGSVIACLLCQAVRTVAVGVYPPPVSSLRTLLETAFARLAAIGADSRDDEETRVRKALLVLVSVLILPISLLWGGLYLALGAPSGVLAFIYFAISLGAIALFAGPATSRCSCTSSSSTSCSRRTCR